MGVGAGVVAISGIGVVRDFVMVMCTVTRLMVSSGPGNRDLRSAGVSFVTLFHISDADIASYTRIRRSIPLCLS